MPVAPNDRPGRRRRGRRVTTALSALAVGATMAGVMPGVADASQPHASSSSTYRVLSVVTTSNVPQATRTTELQYTAGPHRSRYLLRHRYSGSKRAGWTLEHTTWEKDFLEDRQHQSVLAINIDRARRTWVEREKKLGRLPAPPLGIQSSRQAVEQAVEEGTAHPFGLTRIDGQRVRLLYLVPSARNQRTTELYVNAATDRPVSEIETTTSGPSEKYVSTARSHWEQISRHALNQLRAKPKAPAGYSISRP